MTESSASSDVELVPDHDRMRALCVQGQNSGEINVALNRTLSELYDAGKIVDDIKFAAREPNFGVLIIYHSQPQRPDPGVF